MHPVVYYYSKIPFIQQSLSINERKKILLKNYTSHIHLMEDFLTFWTDPIQHQIQFRRFVESIVKKDLKSYNPKTCLEFHAFMGFYPEMCKIYFEKQL